MTSGRFLAFAVLAVSLLGCAMASLHIETGIYKGDPIIITQARAIELIVTLDRTVLEADRLVELRLELVEAMLNFYRRYQVLVSILNERGSNPRRDTENHVRNVLLPVYKNELEEVAGKIESLAAAIKELVQSTIDNQVSQTENGQTPLSSYVAMISKLGEVRRQFSLLRNNDFGKPIKEGFLPLLQSPVNQLRKLDDDSLKIPKVVSELRKFRTAFSEVETVLSKIGQVKARQAEEILGALNIALANLSEPHETPITEVASKAAALIADTSLKAARTARSDLVLSGLARGLNLYTSQIDRVQDPADPAWRIVVEADETQWVNLFSKTYYSARGKASVVVARDRPGHYRIIRAVNNPAKLIAGQLRLSRAVASVAIDAALASQGIATSMKDSSTSKSGQPEKPQDAKDDASEPVVEKAQLEQELATRNQIRANLRRNLEVLKVKVESTKDGTSIDATLKSAILGTIQSHEQVLRGISKEK